MTRVPKRLSTGVIVVRFTDGKARFLLLRAYRYWDFPKGEVEEGEEPLATAMREVAEETGLSNLDFRWGENFYETERYARDKVARYYLAESRTGSIALGISAELGRPEHHEYLWATAGEARRLVNDRVRAALDWAHARVAAESEGRR